MAQLRLWYCDAPVNDLQQLKQQQRQRQGQPPGAFAAGGGPTATAAGAAAGGPTSSSSSTSAAAAAAAGREGLSSQPVWKVAAESINLSPGQNEVTVSFELPLLLSCLMVEFVGFHISVNELSSEVLHCPRCSHVVSDKHGLCSYCRCVERSYHVRRAFEDRVLLQAYFPYALTCSRWHGSSWQSRAASCLFQRRPSSCLERSSLTLGAAAVAVLHDTFNSFLSGRMRISAGSVATSTTNPPTPSSAQSAGTAGTAASSCCYRL